MYAILFYFFSAHVFFLSLLRTSTHSTYLCYFNLSSPSLLSLCFSFSHSCFLCTPLSGHIPPVLETVFDISFLELLEKVTDNFLLEHCRSCITKSAHNRASLPVLQQAPRAIGCCAEGLSEQVQALIFIKLKLSSGKSMDVRQPYNSLCQQWTSAQS